MVVHLTKDGYREDGKQPVGNIPIGPHWVHFDEDRWREDADYGDRLRRLYEIQAPAFLYGRTPYDIELDQVRDDGLLMVEPAAGVVGVHDDLIRHLLISNTKQTGDVPHIAAAMVHDPMLDVLIVHTPETAAGAAEMVAAYRHAIRHAVQGERHGALSTCRGLRPPKRLGKAIRAAATTPGAPKVTLRDESPTFVSAREARAEFERGYTPDDLVIIEKQIRGLSS
jgi:hypothetical protein